MMTIPDIIQIMPISETSQRRRETSAIRERKKWGAKKTFGAKKKQRVIFFLTR